MNVAKKADPSINIPDKMLFLVTTKSRFKILRGGRGSAKSGSIARGLVFKTVTSVKKILCTRELQNSIADSVHSLLKGCVDKIGLNHVFESTLTNIRSANGSNFIFKGLRNNINEIKSMDDIDICWVEEAAKIDAKTWDILIPTIRNKGSEIWISYNPDEESDATHQRYGKITYSRDSIEYIKYPFYQKSAGYKKNQLVTEPGSTNADFTVWESKANNNLNNPLVEGKFWTRYMISREVNYVDNPFFEETELVAEMLACKEQDPEKYNNIWEGKAKSRSDAQVFKDKWEVQQFITPPVSEMYHQRVLFGADWGFNPDPCTMIRCFIKDGKLFIDYEAYQAGVELDGIDGLFQTVPESKLWKIYGDSARPDIISKLSKLKYKIYSVKKTTVSLDPLSKQKADSYVKSGIDYIKNFEKVIIHPRCVNTISEFTNYKHKVDKNTEIILPEIIDKYNHLIDALRYALADYISKPKSTMADIARARLNRNKGN